MTDDSKKGAPAGGATARAAFGDFAPKLAELTDDLLIGEIWQRPGLCPRDRSLITVAVLTALARHDALAAHLRIAVDNGITRDEIIELITHVSFYGGWPTGMSAVSIAKRMFNDLADREKGRIG